MLISLGRKELDGLAAGGEEIEVCCHFCDKKYTFSPAEIIKMMEDAT